MTTLRSLDGLASDRIHRAGGLDEAGGVDLVAFLGRNAAPNGAGDLGLRAPARIVLTSVSSRLNRQFRSLPSAVMRNRSQLMQNGRLTDEIKPMFPTPSANAEFAGRGMGPARDGGRAA